MTGEAFPVGVNYWPRRKAMAWWHDFDADEVAGEFDVIAELGLTLVRIFLLWEDFQPYPDRVAPDALEELGVVADLAADRGLGLDVTFFTGHMSGPNWAPPWLLGGDMPVPDDRQVISGDRHEAGPYRNPFVDTVALDAQELLVQTVVARLQGHPGVWGWNLGNEPDLFALPPTADAGPAWARRMISAIRALDSDRRVTVGLHAPSLMEDNGLRADRMFNDCDVAVMHCYPIYADFGAGPLDRDAVPFATALTAALAGRPTLMEEFGAATAPPGAARETWTWSARGRTERQLMVSEAEFAEHLDVVLPALVGVGAAGALLWSFADYAEELWDRPPCDTKRHERHFGLVRPDGTLKPHAEVVRRFVGSGPRIGAPEPRARFDIDGPSFYRDVERMLPELYRAFTGTDG